MIKSGERGIQTVVFLSRWLMVPFLAGLICGVVLIAIRFFIDLVSLAMHMPGKPWQDLIVGVLNLVDLTLVANLVLIVIFSAFQNYIHKVEPADRPSWPPGLIDIDFAELKQKLLGSIAGIAAVDALGWYLDLENHADTTKFGWAIGFPLMFVVAMVLLACADWLGRRA
jgi:uncharacterized protein (TIGR00645 family)